MSEILALARAVKLARRSIAALMVMLPSATSVSVGELAAVVAAASVLAVIAAETVMLPEPPVPAALVAMVTLLPALSAVTMELASTLPVVAG